jgi:nucleoside-diphosphate-sugar epimerase
MPRALVLGSGGFIGRHLLQRLRSDGWDVAAHTRRNFDLADANSTSLCFGAYRPVEYIFHAADVLDGFTPNVRMAINVLESWRASQPQAVLVGFSSLWAYPAGNGHYAERAYDDGPAEVPHYAAAKKLLGTGIATFKRLHGMRGTMIALGNVYGPGDTSDRAIPSLLRRARRGDFLVECADTKRNYTFINDAIAGILACRDAEEPLVNVASEPAELSVMASHIAEALHCKWARGDRPGTVRTIDCSLSGKYCPRLTMAHPTAIRRTIEAMP